MKNFENLELLEVAGQGAQGGPQRGASPPVAPATGANADSREQAIRGRNGDTADIRRRGADQVQDIGKAIADGNIQLAMQLIQQLNNQLIAVEATAADKNFQARLQLEIQQGSIGNMLKIFGTMLSQIDGLEEFGESMVRMADHPNLRLDEVNPNTDRLEGLRDTDTTLDPSLRTQGRDTIIAATGDARDQAALTPGEAANQAQRGNNAIEGRPLDSTGGPAASREPITVARAISAGAGLDTGDMASINPAFARADTNNNRILEQAETPAFRQALTPAAREKLEPLFR